MNSVTGEYDIAIMQPTYLPWPGYFNLIFRSKKFVFLDDVKFEKSSWHTRNQIPQNGKAAYLTIPVTGSREQLLSEVRVNDSSNWRAKHIRSLEQAYAKAPFRDQLMDRLSPAIRDTSLDRLAELNIRIIQIICEYLHIQSEILLSSEIKPQGQRSERLVDLLGKLDCRSYLSPAGAREYIETDDLLEKSGIEITYQKAILQPYQQAGNKSEFLPNMSVVDLIANLGPEAAREYILQLDPA